MSKHYCNTCGTRHWTYLETQECCTTETYPAPQLADLQAPPDANIVEAMGGIDAVMDWMDRGCP